MLQQVIFVSKPILVNQIIYTLTSYHTVTTGWSFSLLPSSLSFYFFYSICINITQHTIIYNIQSNTSITGPIHFILFFSFIVPPILNSRITNSTPSTLKIGNYNTSLYPLYFDLTIPLIVNNSYYYISVHKPYTIFSLVNK